MFGGVGKNDLWKTKFQREVVSSILNITETHRHIPLKSLTRSNTEIPGGMQITTKGLKRFKIFLFVPLFSVKVVVSCQENFIALVLSTRLLQSS